MVNLNSNRWKILRVLYYAERPMNTREIVEQIYPPDAPDFGLKLRTLSSVLCKLRAEGNIQSVGRFMNHSHLWVLPEYKREYVGRKLASQGQSQSQQADNQGS
jgi:hypothetical protein